MKRKIEKVTLHKSTLGMLGKGHLSTQIIGFQNFIDTDPFIVLMDEKLDISGTEAAGGEHPHAGVEIYTLLFGGSSGDIPTGNMELMTAGKGVVHTEEVKGNIQANVLQLWVALPPEKRCTEPFLQSIDLENVPTLKTKDGEIRVYSGSAFELTSPLRCNTPITIVDFNLESYAETTQYIPSSYNGFVLVKEGNVSVSGVEVKQGESGWLNKIYQSGESEITYKAGEGGARFVLYAGEPQKRPIVIQGPFIGDTHEDISRLFTEYRNDKMKHIRSYPSKHFTSRPGKTMN